MSVVRDAELAYHALHSAPYTDSPPLCSGSGIFNSSNPEAYARAIVEATTHYNDPLKIAEVSTGLGAGMKGENDLNREGLISA